MRHFEPVLERLQRTGVALVDNHEKLLLMEETVYAHEMPGKRYDIGNMESYKKIQRGIRDLLFGKSYKKRM